MKTNNSAVQLVNMKVTGLSQMIDNVKFLPHYSGDLNTEVLSNICAGPAANKQWGSNKFSLKVPVYKVTVMSCWRRGNTTTVILLCGLVPFSHLCPVLMKTKDDKVWLVYMLILRLTKMRKKKKKYRHSNSVLNVSELIDICLLLLAADAYSVKSERSKV